MHNLRDGGGAGVTRHSEHPDGRLLGLDHVRNLGVLLILLVLNHLGLVVLLEGFPLGKKFLVNGFDKKLAESLTALARGGAGGQVVAKIRMTAEMQAMAPRISTSASFSLSALQATF